MNPHDRLLFLSFCDGHNTQHVSSLDRVVALHPTVTLTITWPEGGADAEDEVEVARSAFGAKVRVD